MSPSDFSILRVVALDTYSGLNVVWRAPQVTIFSRSSKRMSSVWLGKLKIMSTLMESKYGAASPMRSKISSPLPYFL